MHFIRTRCVTLSTQHHELGFRNSRDSPDWFEDSCRYFSIHTYQRNRVGSALRFAPAQCERGDLDARLTQVPLANKPNDSRLEPASVVKLQRKLYQPRPARLTDLPEGSAESLIIRIQELRVVEGIKQFCPKFDRFGLRDFRSLQKRNVPVVNARSTECVSTQISKRSE